MSHRKLADEMIKDIQRFVEEADALYRVTIPGKVVELRKLLQHLEQTGAFQTRVTIHQHPQLPRATTHQQPQLPGGHHGLENISAENAGAEDALKTCDPNLHKVMATLKPYYTEGLLHASKIHTWLALLVPRSTDEFSVLTEARDAIHKAAEPLHVECRDGLQGIVDFYRVRAKHMSKACKYPLVEDYRVTVREHDETKLAMLHLSLQTLGERYIVLYDALFKNNDIVNAPLIYKTDAMY
ncbi:proteasome activator complex subunit 3-like [Littorina saxatilis]|uniref:proteasome activator complex subunit 3-like n=1 Tax=Littorina saxatilis TaxID=31220 RepID=UPI0038B52241